MKRVFLIKLWFYFKVLSCVIRIKIIGQLTVNVIFNYQLSLKA